MDGLYHRAQRVFNGKAVYYGDRVDTHDFAIYHDLTHWTAGIRSTEELHLRTHIEDASQVCPTNVTTWMVTGDTGWLENRYVTLDCWYPNLMDERMFVDRLQINATRFENDAAFRESKQRFLDKAALIRFFDDSPASQDTNDAFAAFIRVFPNIHAYSSKLSVHQVNCNVTKDTDQGFVDYYCGPEESRQLPKITVLNATLSNETSQDPNFNVISFLQDDETLEQMIENTLRIRERNHSLALFE